MIRDIKKKLIILNNRGPLRPEVRSFLNDLELKEWIYMNLRLSGSNLTTDSIDTILGGGYVLDARLDEHLLIDRLRQLRQYLYRMSDMDGDISKVMLGDINRIINGEDGQKDFRRSNSLIMEYQYTPISPSEIIDAIEDFLSFAKDDDLYTDHIKKAVKLHMRIIEIFPYSEGNEYIARSLMYYWLLRKGYPIAALDMGEQAYNDSIIEYLKTGSGELLYSTLLKAIHAKLSLMMQLTGYEEGEHEI